MKATNKSWKMIGDHLPGRDVWTMKQRWKQLNAAKTGEGEGEKKDEAKPEEKKDKEDEKKEEKKEEEKAVKEDEKKDDDKDGKKEEKKEEPKEEKKEEKKEETPLKSALKTTKTETKADTAPKKLGDKPIIYMDKDDQCTTEDVGDMSLLTAHPHQADIHHHGSILYSTSCMAERRKTSGLRSPPASSTRPASVLTHNI